MSAEVLSLVALVIALSSAVINYMLLRLQRDPEVVVYAVHDPKRPTILNLIIENTGKGTAHGVQFKASNSIPSRAFGFEDAPMPEEMNEGPLINGIPTLGAGEKRITTWGQYYGLKKGLADNVLEITATYHSFPNLKITRQKHKTVSSIDIRSFEGTDASDQNWDKKAADELRKIASSLSKIAVQYEKSQLKGSKEGRASE